MEIDALYADTVVARWEKFTGRKAERISARSNAPAVETVEILRSKFGHGRE